MLRGADESGVESIAEAADVVEEPRRNERKRSGGAVEHFLYQDVLQRKRYRKTWDIFVFLKKTREKDWNFGLDLKLWGFEKDGD